MEVLHLTTTCTLEYLDAKRWEQLITTSMPNLRIFDLYHTYAVDDDDDPLTFHDIINEFDSPFWIEKKWFFKHQHSPEKYLSNGVFYSTNPYR